ncbi:hypothetical protein CONPUDRAFT_68717 [Coniophora puteana RWD-64-598 SS2]|uniref:F-box domain-containing protein n=1 Tax=Coniophora puteana (strain RWD-64-598) TaxID=741705 RepID=A0A5M3N402_CONPW|nr:uncharacterized protein CONPUDRAFT_68717 [Coniophora puteana RWD-64-598 SS2]EIW86113.1 hypothetical protein CONPUDRAFT_68717 [Coniophora puteana RWD-64-598 SS2]
MHHALQINEIITIVVWFVGQPDSSVNGEADPQKSLAALARVCRTLSEPALDVLWSDLSSLFPLFRCLPGDLITYHSMHVFGNFKFQLRRRFTHRDWDVFFKYSARVVKLRVIPEGPECIPPEIYLALSLPPASIVFPRLRRLHWVEWTGTAERCIFMRQLLGPSIIQLNLTFTSRETMTAHFLGLVSTLGALCPRVKDVEFFGQGDLQEDAVGALSETICSWHDLEVVQCFSRLNITALRHLASLNSLRILRLQSLMLNPYPTDLWGVSNGSPFPGIHSITLNSTFSTLSTAAEMVSSLQQMHVAPRSFTAAAGRVSENSMVQLFQSIANGFDREALTDVSVSELAFLAQTLPESSRINPDMFRHILSFQNLRCIDIQSRRDVFMTDGALLQMATSWPHLSSLRINQRFGWQTRSNVTLHGLRNMLQALPWLIDLAVAIDADTFCPMDVESDKLGNFCIYRPFTIDLLDSWVSKNIPEVAAFLADIFPLHEIGRQDRSIHAWKNTLRTRETSGYVNAWETVIRTVGVINKVSLKRPQTQLRFDRDGDYDNEGAYNIDGGLLLSD